MNFIYFFTTVSSEELYFSPHQRRNSCFFQDLLWKIAPSYSAFLILFPSSTKSGKKGKYENRMVYFFIFLKNF